MLQRPSPLRPIYYSVRPHRGRNLQRPTALKDALGAPSAMARRLQRPRPLRQKATAPRPTGADVLQRTYALRFDRATRARSGQAGARARRRAPAAMAGRGDAQSRTRRSGRVGGAHATPQTRPHASRARLGGVGGK